MKAKQWMGALSLTLVAGMAHAQSMEITHSEDRETIMGSSELFTGQPIVNMLFRATDSTRATAAEVTFAPGERTNWHTHPAGQTLIVTDGVGWVQVEGKDKQIIKQGDVVWFPPGIKHWHGASDTNSMSHIAVQEEVSGNNVDWMEPVTNEQYVGD